MLLFNESQYDIFPSKRVWRRQGFVFKRAEHADNVTLLELPKGWKSEINENQFDFYDENNTRRGVLVIGTDDAHSKDISLKLCRYSVIVEYMKETNSTLVYFGNDKERLYFAGQIYMPDETTEEEKEAIANIIKGFIKNAKEYADENYPDYQNPDAYRKAKKHMI